ncbi:MAG TPA: amidohydrolase family protein, partial [Ilumatobacteraceae bacterium]
MSHDLVIRDGWVIDGTGTAARRADVAIDGGLIVAVGEVDERGRREIDAADHVVTPGFIDGHTHMDAQVMWDPLGTCSVWHGVTSVVMGNCGFTLAPTRPTERHLVLRSLERAEDISAAAMQEALAWDWESFGDYLDAVDRAPKGINYAAQIGHSALRTWALGEAAFERTADADEVTRMEDELRRALDAGAIGFTTSQNARHETADDRPVASRQAGWDEVARLVAVVGDAGGVFEVALDHAAQSPDPTVRRAYLDQFEELAIATGTP